MVLLGDERDRSLFRRLRRSAASGDLATEPVFHLLVGQTSRAIPGLELAARSPKDALRSLSDLSASYLRRFQSDGDPLDLLRSVEAAERGLAIRPRDSSLLFNRALAFSLLGARALSIQAWRAVEARETGGWKREAAAQLRAVVDRPTADEEWARAAAALEAPGTSVLAIVAATERLPWNARAYGEEVLLPRWAAAAARGDAIAGQRALWMAGHIGDALAASRGEQLLTDAIQAIQRSEYLAPMARRDLHEGLQAFGEGVGHYNEQNLSSAREPLARAAQLLAKTGNPLSYWARFYLAIGEYYGDADSGLLLLDQLRREIPPDRYPALIGRIEWIAGTIHKVQGRIQSSVRHGELAAMNLRRAGGEPAAAFVSVLLAESYSLLGQHTLAWRARMSAFQTVPYSEGPRRNVAMWIEAKEALLRQGELRLAGPLVDQAVADAESWGRPLGRATAYLERAAYWLERAEHPRAERELELAKLALNELEPSGLKDQITFSAQLIEGLSYRLTDPARAAALLERGLSGQAGTGNVFEAITYTTAKASAQLAADQFQAGAQSLEAALAIFERIRFTVEDPVARMQAFRQAQPAFDSLIKLKTTVLATDREEPFALAERSRARVLLELRSKLQAGARALPPFVRLSEIERELPVGATLVSYAVLDDRILAWVVARGHARLLTLRIGRTQVADLIERFRLEMRRGTDDDAMRAAAAPLYDALVRPLRLSPDLDGRLYVIPDRWLSKLPFAALWDRETRQYLIEQSTVTMSPSATLLVRGTGAVPGALSALAVGVTDSGTFEGIGLQRLPNATREALEIAALYADGTSMVGPAATKENFLRVSVSKSMVHFAGHAMVDVEAPRRSVLLFSGQSESLVPLTLGELLDAGMGQTHLVVLSACRAQDSVAEDREGLLGLAGAFLAAGVSEVVASPWDIDDRQTARVMVAFHRAYRTDRQAGLAFRRAVLELLRSGSQEDQSPATWGVFSVINGSFDQGGL